MANTLAAALVTDIVKGPGMTVLQNKLAALDCFSKDFGVDPLKPKATVQVKKATAGSTTLTNASNFESGDSTVGNVAVTVDQKTQPFHITNAELQSGHKLEDLIKINMGAFADALIDIAMTPVTVANFGAASVVALSTAFDTDDLKTLWGALKKGDSRNIVLDGEYFAQFLPTNMESFKPGDGAFGWDKFAMNTRWDGAGANIRGFACHPQALAVAAGLPMIDQGIKDQLVNYEEIEVPGLGLTVAFYVWYSLSTRTMWASFDVMFGAAAGDTTAMKIITSV